MIKKQNKNPHKLEEKTVYFILQLTLSWKEVRAGAEVKAVKEGLLLMPCSDYFLIQLRSICQAWYYPQWAVFPCIQSLMKKLLHRLAHGTVWWRHFFNWNSSLFPADPSLCEVDKNWHKGRGRVLTWSLCQFNPWVRIVPSYNKFYALLHNKVLTEDKEKQV